ncbi:TolC family protein [Vibrio ostreicida]|uniref:TolC family protein n=2 Tax=Vibrio ostreicida TaxID=526588 RepID=A0ABT8BY98_9VIBR|nr:TolC family protein [Vibrio ostreicida]MDN3612003.1 TolC family protein [Vibrio ostreicida]NPD08823.1 TolC family protein [Vibrio ostreicida]
MIPKMFALSICASVWFGPAVANSAPSQTEHSKPSILSQWIITALNNDGNRQQFYAQSQAMREMGVASSTLLDPKLKIGFGGVPVDSFEFDDDPMTNISMGLAQQFSRGSTLQLTQKKYAQQADAMERKIANRELDIINSMTQLWLELGYQQQAHIILSENRQLLEEMESFIQTNYSIGKSEAQDLLNAQLQVSKLSEKIQANHQIQRRILARLSEWLGTDWLANTSTVKASNQLDWNTLNQKLAQNTATDQYYTLLNQHPMIQVANQTITSSETQTEIVKQTYKPQFGVEVMYATRQAKSMSGEPASDLVSAYLTMDIPLFTGNRQDRNLSAAQYQVGAARSQKEALLAQMNGKVNTLLVDRAKITERLDRYTSSLVPQANARIRAVERGYQNNTSQFNDVIDASADKLALQLEQQRLITDLNIVNSNLASLLGGFDYQVTSPRLSRRQQQ